MATRQDQQIREAKERRQAIGRRVAACRNGLGLTQEVVAERAKLTEATVRAVETGRRAPSIDSIAAIASALGVPVATLFADDVVTIGTDAEVARLFRDLDERLQPVVIRFLRDLKRTLAVKRRPTVRGTKS